MEIEKEKGRARRLVVTEHEITRTYELFCEDENFDTTLPQGRLLITTGGSPLKAFDQFEEDKTEILACISDMKRDFENLDERQVDFMELETKLGVLRNKLTLAEGGFLRVINMLMDSLDNTRAEQLKKTQLEAIESTIGMVHWATEDFEVNMIQEILINSGLKAIPSLNGIAKFYR